MEPWDEVWRRNQFLCSAYARRHPDRKVLFVAPAVDVTNAIRRGKLSPLLAKRKWTVPEYPNITVIQALKVAPNSFEAGRRMNEAILRANVRRHAARLGMTKPLLWLNPHSAVHMVGRMGEAAVVYDITDDWSQLTQSASQARLVREQDAELCRLADAVIVCSRKLYELKSATVLSSGPKEARRLRLIPNGVNADHYRKVLDAVGPLPAAAQSWPKPVLGYTGTVHPDRIDVGLVEAIARKWKGSIVLIGPNHLPPRDADRLRFPNVFLPGPMPYADLPDMMRAFDVCIVPHRITAFTESLNPIKLWEYLAAGKPIVSTDVAGFRDYPQFVKLARTEEAFIGAAEAALSEEPSVASARRAEAARHSWESRLDEVDAVIEGCRGLYHPDSRGQESTHGG